MDLPEKFQFRIDTHRDFTHTAKKNSVGDYEVEWAKGWLKQQDIYDPWIVANEKEVKGWVNNGGWIMVGDSKKKFPDEFYFTNTLDHTCHAKLYGGIFIIDNLECEHSCGLDVATVQRWVKRGDWKIIDKRPLTAEQLRFNVEFREQIKALESSIKINEQDIEHKIRLIDNYNERIEQLKAKIVEEV